MIDYLKPNYMKTTNFKAILILGGLMLINVQTASASVIGGIKKFAAEQLTNFDLQALWGIGAIVVGGLIIFFVSNYLNELHEKRENALREQNSHVIKHHHHNHHRHVQVRHIVKKTA